jgi:hypothetical protein
VAAIQQSFRMTRNPRVILQMFLLLSVAYCIPLAVDFLLMPVAQALWVHPVAILLSTLFVAWVNVYITLTFGEIARHREIVEKN